MDDRTRHSLLAILHIFLVCILFCINIVKIKNWIELKNKTVTVLFTKHNSASNKYISNMWSIVYCYYNWLNDPKRIAKNSYPFGKGKCIPWAIWLRSIAWLTTNTKLGHEFSLIEKENGLYYLYHWNPISASLCIIIKL